jgi:hypothetical protein
MFKKYAFSHKTLVAEATKKIHTIYHGSKERCN